MSGEDTKHLEGVISLRDNQLQLLGEWAPLEQTPSGHPIVSLMEYSTSHTTYTTTRSRAREMNTFNTVSEPEAWGSEESNSESNESFDEDAKYSDYESDSDHTESTDHEPDYETASEGESLSDSENEAYAISEDTMYNSKHLSKGQKRKVLRNLKEIADAYTTHEVHVTKSMRKPQCPRPITIKPSARKPGPWRVLEIFTWTAMITMVAGSLSNWDAYEPVTLPRWDLLRKKDQDDAMRYIEERDIDFVVIAWPCTPWSIMQNLNQKPHQLRALKISQEEHRELLVFTHRVANRQYMKARPCVGENPWKSKAWDEPPIQAAFNRPGYSEVVTHMCMYNKRRPDNGLLVRKATMLKGTKEVVEACNRKCDGEHEHSVIEGSMKLPSGKRCNVSEWAGGYTKPFAM
jgi:hypothetical protein